jgi:integrative and conjugative element protein (TIGR02256 family)
MHVDALGSVSVLKMARTRKPRCAVFIDENVLLLVENQGQRATDAETGGIIGGLGSMELGQIVISNASDAGSGAMHLPTFFSRDTAYCQRMVDEWARKSCGKVDYLGEWHKHFQDDPKPSKTDLETLAGIADSPDYHVKTPLLLIIGNSNRRDTIRVFGIGCAGKCTLLDWKASRGRHPL